ncbi:HPr family phosphocarrier protein [[Ruminococcus] torques]|uniref:HPr family phosphocarrier protein n=1 Tax=[Ruminococcus] torques TaxID=33039 RepID=UPI001FA275C5|nr:HPr family phosphocarrier protein [[Ruminococcus] torques]MBS5400175.1 HPr family phosphocarrier protein [Lachnospiraceae bacterium]MDM8237208.1 HPr family phosphocarrier protein [[Ruminococcus] torques]HJC80872.1 HPr family phosphocarrier protein [Candidatus Mediterraneibacter excrementipullorum]
MSEMKLTFKTPDEIVEFVNTVSKYEFDVDVRRGRVVVDAKSLLGIMHLGLNSILELKMHTADGEELETELLKYAA